MDMRLFIVVMFLSMSIFINCNSNTSNDVVEEMINEEIIDIEETTIPKDIESKSYNKEGYVLLFSESFESDLSKWNIWNGGAFNNEIQLYRAEQLLVKNGILTIETKRQAITGNENPWSEKNKNFEYVSGRIESKTDFWPKDINDDNIFIVSARIKLPTGHGMWPAFWLYADPWPTLGEIDILEARGGSGKQFQFNMFYGTVQGKPIPQNSKRTYNAPVDLRSDFHVYELIWEKNKIQIVLDGTVVITVDASANNLEDIFGNELGIVLNNAVGGVFFADKDSANYVSASKMQVDWVRVYKK